MAAFEVPPLNIEKGTDFKASFNIFKDDGTLQPLNGYSATAFLKKHPTSSTTYPFVVTITLVDSSIEIGMAKTVTASLPNGRCYFDVFTTFNSKTSRAITGTAIVTPTNT